MNVSRGNLCSWAQPKSLADPEVMQCLSIAVSCLSPTLPAWTVLRLVSACLRGGSQPPLPRCGSAERFKRTRTSHRLTSEAVTAPGPLAEPSCRHDRLEKPAEGRNFCILC